jgi:protein-tyrosine kinase
MAKVYDALRRAEEERKRQRGGEASTTASTVAVFDIEAGEPPPPAAAAPRWRRWLRLPRLRLRRKKRAKALLGSSDINKRRISLLQPDSYVAEQYRALRGRLDAISVQRPVRTTVVTSPLPGDGKTTAAVNLAIVTAMGVGRRVLLIDCDMRKPKVHRALGLRPEAGLAEVLTDTTSLDQAIVKVEGVNLEVLPVRGLPPNPSELLSSSKMRELVEELARRYDRVIFDTPAALGLPDAKAVCEICDGLVLVVRADVTPQADVRAALDILDPRKLFGLVLNGAEVDQGRYGYAG